MSEIKISEEAKALFDKLDILAFNDAASHECLTAIQLAINSATASLNKRIEELEKEREDLIDAVAHKQHGASGLCCSLQEARLAMQRAETAILAAIPNE